MPLIAAASPASACRALPAHELRIHLVDEAGASRQTLDAAASEAGEIWARIGLRFTWTVPPTLPKPADGSSVIVIIRRSLKRMRASNAASANGRVRAPLGWLMFDTDGRSGNLIEVSFEETAALTRRGVQLDVPVAALPEFARDRTLGRGLGRVIAHEIGHWLMGRGHVETGLMKPRFNAQDLVEFRSPQLPKAWVTRDEDHDATPCVPMALRRLTAPRRQRADATEPTSKATTVLNTPKNSKIGSGV